jgi:predicted deacylase
MPAKRSGARRSFLGVRERPGTVLRRRVAVATWPDGSPLTLPILVAAGAPGPALYVQGGLHGDEIVGVEAARQIVGRVRPREIRGTLVSIR